MLGLLQATHRREFGRAARRSGPFCLPHPAP